MDYSLCMINYGGNTYNLTSLRSANDYYVKTFQSTSYFLNLCGPLASFNCYTTPNASACQNFASFNYALGTSYSQTVLPPNSFGAEFVLNYRGGDAGRSYSIEFFCSPPNNTNSSYPSIPEYMNESPIKTYNFRWITSKACPTPTPTPSRCGAGNVNLSPLRNFTNDYLVSSNGTVFYLNVCGGLIMGYYCSDIPTSICAFPRNRTLGSFSAGLSSYVQYFPTTNGVLAFFHGVGKFTAEIQFYCDPSVDKGSPTFILEFPEFHYRFNWGTRYACGWSNSNKITIT
eukprot:TRINITY_DN1821_c0_g1_i1.p1 TRINITY_DN1821_c0_g1~~TRINITY_DN1821_c0_g1_i1.p1  ORF type:complete len:323 (+),score=60.17 TRINITY_DN1821_c0_g1_i1:112-969(+)